MSKQAKIVCISGVDGSGKSTLVDAIRERAESQGKRVEVRWLRFNHFYSRPLMVLCNLLGMTQYQMVDGHRIGKHNFGKPRLLAKAFAYLQFLDARRVARRYWDPKNRGRVDLLILDRFALDILADISVATDDPGFLESKRAKSIEALLPADTLSIGVQRSEEALLACRPESAVDPSFAVRLRAYAALFGRPGLHVIKNEGSQADLVAAALKLMES